MRDDSCAVGVDEDGRRESSSESNILLVIVLLRQNNMKWTEMIHPDIDRTV